MVYYLFKSLLLISSVEFTLGEVVLPAIVCYVIFKVGGMALVKMNKLDDVDHRQLEERSKYAANE
jgi:hypothetical protein